MNDANGNLTDDGVFKYKYDWLNRLVQVKRREDVDTIVALYAYDGLNRRIRKDVTNTGIAIVPGSDAGGAPGISCGDRIERYYYADWRVVEDTDNATTPRTLAQTV